MTESTEHIYFINSLYRDFLLPTILGKDDSEILYWAGKHISRKYALSTIEDLIDFFNMAEFGELELIKDKKHYALFKLTGQSVSDRLDSDSHEFSLESGIIAECLQRHSGKITEASATVYPKEHYVEITAQSD
ncbi:YslB family protein [Lactobacillus sp.]|uniref:YslB family protein n=1 Tax=Lactobacillus sp. TaxID=1591 RepID=UPI0019B47B36|nr:YslB family protein [Lactobacillus sp.]MBD5429965.1 YslB family protein [Lactobacillus sp.]